MSEKNGILEQERTHLEKLMVQLPSTLTETERRTYLAGYVDCLGDNNHVSEEERQILYGEYAL